MGRRPRTETAIDLEYARLNKLSRERALTLPESLRLERIIKEIDARAARRLQAR
jgi:hypothetical protein